MAAMLVASAMPAFADNVKVPGQNGPPLLSGNENGAIVLHCNAIEGLKGNLVLTPNGDIRGGGCSLA